MDTYNLLVVRYIYTTMRKITISIILVIVISIITYSYPGSNKSLEIHKVGVLLPITGDASVYGESAQKAALLADNNGGQIITEDTALSGQKAISAFQKIKSSSNPKVIVSFSSGETLALCPVTEKAGITLISSGSSPEIGKCGPNTFSNFPSDTFQSRVLADKLNIATKHLAVLYIQNDYGTGVFNEFKKHYAGQIDSYPYTPSQSDYRTLLSKIKSSNIRNILLISQPKEATSILSQAADLNLTIDSIYATESLKDNSFANVIPSKFRNVFVVVSPKTYSGTEQVSFQNSYMQKFGTAPTAYADYVYDNIALAKDALRNCAEKTKKDNACIREYIKNANKIGATGNISFGDSMSPEDKEYDFFKIGVDGKFSNEF